MMQAKRMSKSREGSRQTSMLVAFLVIVGAFAGMVNLMSGNAKAQDIWEPDDMPGQANFISTDGTMQSHTFHIADDEDWIFFSATEGSEYAIETHNLGASADTYIYLYDSTGESILDEDDDGGVGLCSKIEWLALKNDNLFVRVTELGGGGGPTDYDYDINVIEVSTGPTFYIPSVVPIIYTIAPGEVVTYDVTVSSLAGYVGNVDLSLASNPPLSPPAIFTFVPSTVMVPSGGSASSTLTISNTAAVLDGQYTLTITGNDGTTIRTYDVYLAVNSLPFFAISVDPYSQAVAQGGIATYTVTLESKNGYTGNVDLNIWNVQPSGLIPPAIASFSPNPVAVPSGGSATSTLTFSNTATVAPNSYMFVVNGMDVINSIINYNAGELTIQSGPVPHFTVTVAPPSQTIVLGDSPSYSVTVTSVDNYAGNVNLGITSAPAGLIPPAIATFVPATVSVPAGGSAVSTLTITNTGSVAGNTYMLTITGSDGSLIDAASADLIVSTNPFFTVSAIPSSRTIEPGDSTTYSITVASVNNYAGNVDLGIAATPVGLIPPATGEFVPATVTVSAGGSATSTLTIANTNTVAEDTYELTVTGSEGALTDTASVDLIVETTQPGKIKGTVEDQNDDPVDDVTIELLEGTNVVEEMKTDSDGEYEFTNVDPGAYTVRASKNGYLPDEKTVTLSSGETEIVDLVIELGTISGRLTDEETGDPIEDARVEIYDEDGNLVDVVTTDHNGRFSVDLELGTYDVTIEAEDHKSIFRGDLDLTESDSDVNLGTLRATPTAEKTLLGDYWWLILIIVIVIVVAIVLAAVLRKKKPIPAPVQPRPQPRQVQAPPPPPPAQTPPPPPPGQ